MPLNDRLDDARKGAVMILLALPVAFGIVHVSRSANPPGQYKKPFRGLVPDEKTALAIGEAVLKVQAGEDYVEAYRPLRARKIEGRWVIDGLAEKARAEQSSFEDIQLAIDPANGSIPVYGFLNDRRMLAILKKYKAIKLPPPSEPGK